MEVQELIKNWDEHYPGAREELPRDMPTPKGKKVILIVHMCMQTMHMNNSPSHWVIDFTEQHSCQVVFQASEYS